MKLYKVSDGIPLPHPFQWHEQWDGQQLTTLDALEIRRQQLVQAVANAEAATLDQQGQDDLASDILELEALDANLDALIDAYHINLTNQHEVIRSNKAMAQLTRTILWKPDNQTTSLEGEFQLSPGGKIFDLPDHIEALWGEDEEILWARGEPLMIYGPTGIGKTTLAGNLVLSLIGIRDTDLLHYPVTPLAPDKTVLYVAADRPRQAMRSLKRMVNPQHRTILDQRLVIEHNRQIWAPQADHQLIWRACQQARAGVVLLDSTKDVADGPLKDEPAAKAFMDAIQVCIANDVDVLMLHHPRKGARDSTGQEESIDGVYGSTWLTAGSGSVLLVDGEPGFGTITIQQLKAPATFVEKMNVVVTYDTGHLERANRVDLADMLQRFYPEAAEVKLIAAFLTGKNTDDLTRGEIQKARREANKLVEYGLAVKLDGTPAKYQWRSEAVLDMEGLESGV